MNIRTMLKLEKLGWDQDWLDDVKRNFHPRKQGKYQIKIYSMTEQEVKFGDEPDVQQRGPLHDNVYIIHKSQAKEYYVDF